MYTNIYKSTLVTFPLYRYK